MLLSYGTMYRETGGAHSQHIAVPSNEQQKHHEPPHADLHGT